MVWQRFEQGSIDKGENGHASGNAERNDENCSDGESWSLAELTESEPDIGKDRFERGPLPDFPAALFDQSHIAVLAASNSFCIFTRHAAVHQVGSFFVEVFANRF